MQLVCLLFKCVENGVNICQSLPKLHQFPAYYLGSTEVVWNSFKCR
jgi:hypothetical protein